MSATTDQVVLYMGRPIEELSREELIEALIGAARQNARMREESTRMIEHLDVRSYLMAGGKG